jgi:excisionase family DNA binding protein
MPDSSPNRPVSGEDPWLTVPQVSSQVRIHPATVRIWIKSGRLAAVRVGREWRVRQSEVDRALVSEASPAYAEQEADSARQSDAGSARTAAPRQIADHLMTVTTPRPEERA